MKRRLDSLPTAALEGQRALVRVDFNTPMSDGRVTDETRIRASLQTINWLRAQGCRVVLMSHLGRPGEERKDEFSLKPVVRVLERLLGAPIVWIPDPVADEAVTATRRMKRGEVAVVENTRFYPGEKSNDADLAKQFAALGDFFVNDAFGAAHRAHASVNAVAQELSPAVAGFLLAKELDYLGSALSQPKRPFVAVIGGAKISGKIEVIEALLPSVDELLIGGAMACTFFIAMGYEVGKSLVERERVDIARDLLDRDGRKIVLPTGVVVAQKLSPDATIREVPRDNIRRDWAVYDIDAKSAEQFSSRIHDAMTILWNGPMGVFEMPPFDRGTLAVAKAMADATRYGATTIVGGGDSVAALSQAGLQDAVSHVSTGGGASLQFLEGRPLPGVEVLDDA